MRALYFVVVLAVLLSLVYAYDKRHKKANYKGRGHKHKGHTSKIMFPISGEHNVPDPTDSKEWNCNKPRAKTPVLSRRSTGNFKKDYKNVMAELKDLKAAHKNIKIEKVINSCTWNRYKQKKKLTIQRGQAANERMLFLTTKYPYSVATKGLDERFSKLESGAYGAGLYFSDKLSNIISSPNKRKGKNVVLFCRVILGKTKDLQTPEALPHAPVGFNSVHGESDNTYVLYRGDLAYVEYIITY